MGCVEGFGPGRTTLGSIPLGTTPNPITIGPNLCEFLSGTARDICLGIIPDDGLDFSPSPNGCGAGFIEIDGECIRMPGGDITPGRDTPAERGPGAASGLAIPSRVPVSTLKCPRFADGKTGILWMNALTGEVVCLPRRTSGRGFGLIRKNPPRAKPPMSAADFKQLKRNKRLAEKAKKLAMDSGFTCKKR